MLDCRTALEQIQLQVDGELGEASRIDLEDHISECSVCKTQLNNYRILHENLLRLPDVTPSRSMVTQIIKPKKSFVLLRRLAMTGSAAAVLVIALVSFQNMNITAPNITETKESRLVEPQLQKTDSSFPIETTGVTPTATPRVTAQETPKSVVASMIAVQVTPSPTPIDEGNVSSKMAAPIADQVNPVAELPSLLSDSGAIRAEVRKNDEAFTLTVISVGENSKILFESAVIEATAIIHLAFTDNETKLEYSATNGTGAKRYSVDLSTGETLFISEVAY